ncbi:hypothetical protein NCHU2750_29120 [Neorhizobium sp. NCHU2750]|nr:hypothetical protein NCHU2750_29120 [Neorhizobium sp. NCHU2750]
MPVKLPQTEPIDPRLLSFLGQVAVNRGHLLLCEEDYEILEDESFFRDAARRGLVTVDQGGEWSSGAIISITRHGRALIGEPERQGFWKRLELMFRQRSGGTGA